MPRKRSTRTVITEEEREYQNKVEAFLEDFQVQAKIHKDSIRTETEKLISSIKNKLSVQVASLPQSIRELTIGEYQEKGDGIDTDEIERIEDVVQGILKHSPVKSKPRKGKKMLKKKTNKETPFLSKMMSTRRTPAVLPKFDYRIGTPTTSRRARPGEILMSVAGSPVITTLNLKQRAAAGTLLKMKGGTELNLPALQNLVKGDKGAIDHTTEKNLLEVQLQVANILKNLNS